MITIYKYTSPSNKVYIGQTCKSTQAQRAGFQGSQYKGCPAFWNAIQKYGWNNFIYEVLETVEERTIANEREQYYISFYQSNNPLYGYNINAGGYDSSNFEYLQRLQDIKMMWDHGATVKEIKDKYKLSQQTLAYELTQLGIDGKERIKRSAGQYRAKIVYQYNQQKELINQYISTAEAERITGIANIRRTCQRNEEKNQLSNTAGGYYWSYILYPGRP